MIRYMYSGCNVINDNINLMQECDLGDEYGWKQVHGDVFRAPAYPVVFSSIIGTGCQIMVVALFSILLAIVGDYYQQ